MNGKVLLEVHLVHAPERAQEIAQAGPEPFDGVVVNLADAVAILITRPLALTRRVADGDVDAIGLAQMAVGAPLVGVDDRPRLGRL